MGRERHRLKLNEKPHAGLPAGLEGAEEAASDKGETERLNFARECPQVI